MKRLGNTVKAAQEAELKHKLTLQEINTEITVLEEREKEFRDHYLIRNRASHQPIVGPSDCERAIDLLAKVPLCLFLVVCMSFDLL
jgi:hypothetical protein